MTRLDVVVPSAGDPVVALPALAALATAREQAGTTGSVVVVDDRPERSGVLEAAASHGFATVEGPRRGPGPARNMGSTRTTSPWTLFLDDDVLLDAQALVGLPERVADRTGVAAVGLLRPPEGAERWVLDGYRTGVMLSVNALRRTTRVPRWGLASGLLLVRTDVLGTIGGFPTPGCGRWEDALLGDLLWRRYGSDAVVVADTLTGVHAWLPDASEWLQRMAVHGRLAAELLREEAISDPKDFAGAVGQGRGARSRLRRALAHLPQALLEAVPGRTARRASGAAAFTRAFVEAGGAQQ